MGTTAAPKPKAEHKVKKKETMETIAKKYGFKKIKDIWDYPKNKALVKQRKDPKAIEVGDVVVIPAYNDKERAEIKERHEKYLYAANMEKLAAATMKESAKLDRELADKIDKLAAKHAADADAYIKEYQASVKKADNWSKGVDFAAMVANILNALRGLALKSIKASEAIAKQAEKEFKKIYKEMVADAAAFRMAPITSEMTKAAGKSLVENKASGPAQDLLIFWGVALESYGKWTSPSFYGQAVSLLAEGKGWSEASTFDLKRDCKETVARMEKEKANVQKVAKQKAAAARNRAAWADNASKAAEKKQKELFDEAKKLG